jgi:hypothetical protein
VNNQQLIYQWNQRNPMGVQLTHSGWMHKRGEVNTSFKNRWFQLNGYVLQYFASQAGRQKGTLDLRLCTGVHAAFDRDSAEQIIEVVMPGRTYKFQPPGNANTATFQTWLQMLQSAAHLTSAGAFTVPAVPATAPYPPSYPVAAVPVPVAAVPVAAVPVGGRW